MKDEIKLDGIKFWVEEDIIFCKIKSDFFESYNKTDVQDIFYNTISILSPGKYMPFLIDLKGVSCFNAIKLFKNLAFNGEVRRLILSQIFLVRSMGVKVILIFFSLIKKPFFYNKICSNREFAIKFCIKDNMVFYPSK